MGARVLGKSTSTFALYLMEYAEEHTLWVFLYERERFQRPAEFCEASTSLWTWVHRSSLLACNHRAATMTSTSFAVSKKGESQQIAVQLLSEASSKMTRQWTKVTCYCLSLVFAKVTLSLTCWICEEQELLLHFSFPFRSFCCKISPHNCLHSTFPGFPMMSAFHSALLCGNPCISLGQLSGISEALWSCLHGTPSPNAYIPPPALKLLEMATLSPAPDISRENQEDQYR